MDVKSFGILSMQISWNVVILCVITTLKVNKYQRKSDLLRINFIIICRCKIKFWPPPPIEYRPGVTIQWIFRWIMTLPSCWILIAPLNFDTLLSRNSTGRRYVDGSEFHVELWPRVKIPRWIVTLDQNFTLKCDPDLGSQFNVILGPGVIIQREIMTRGHNSTWHSDPGSKFNVESWPGVSIQRGIMTRVTIQRGIMTRGHNSTWKHDPGSQFNVEFWPGVTIQRGILTRGHNSTWNSDPGSQFNVESWPMVTILLVIRSVTDVIAASPPTHFTNLLWVRSTSVTDLIANLSHQQPLFSRE